jgi:hypothetical protein
MKILQKEGTVICRYLQKLPKEVTYRPEFLFVKLWGSTSPHPALEMGIFCRYVMSLNYSSCKYTARVTRNLQNWYICVPFLKMGIFCRYAISLNYSSCKYTARVTRNLQNWYICVQDSTGSIVETQKHIYAFGAFS